MHGLATYFAGKKYQNVGAVLEDALRIARQLKPASREARLSPEQLRGNLEKLLANPAALPHHAPAYAVYNLGFSANSLAKFFGVVPATFLYQIKVANEILAGKRKSAQVRGKVLVPGSAKFASIEEFLEHVSEVSNKIVEQPRPRQQVARPARPKFIGPRNLSPLERKVAEIARSMPGESGYYWAQIIEQLYGKKRKDVDYIAWEQYKNRVEMVLSSLRRKGVIQKIERKPKPPLRKASREDIEKHINMVHWVLRRGHRFLRRDWRRHLTYKEAIAAGMSGLTYAIEHYDPRLGNFTTFAAPQIAGRISNFVSKIARSKRIEEHAIHLDATAKDDRTFHERIAASEEDPRKAETRQLIRQAFKLHHGGLISKPNLTIFALRIAGHTLQEIGTHYGVTHETIRRREKELKGIMQRSYGKDRLSR